MTRIRIAPIVEGHGEDQAIRTLLQRIWHELLGGEYIDVLKPIRGKRNRLDRPEELSRAINLALLKSNAAPARDLKLMVLVLVDADKSLPCELGPKLLRMAQSCRGDVDTACVIANVEYETWFVAAAESLTEFLEINDVRAIPARPETVRAGKGWIKQHFVSGQSYSETVDQPRMTAKMDLAQCRQRSPSFDKLCRELERRFGSLP